MKSFVEAETIYALVQSPKTPKKLASRLELPESTIKAVIDELVVYSQELLKDHA